MALRSRDIVSFIRDGDVEWEAHGHIAFNTPLRRIRGVGRVFEVRADFVAGDGCEVGAGGCLCTIAVGVVDGQLLHRRAGPEEEAADGREDDTDGEEEREDGLGGEDGLPCL